MDLRPTDRASMLDEEHPDLQAAENDTNTYTLGRIEQHNVVLACLPTVSVPLPAIIPFLLSLSPTGRTYTLNL